MISNRKVCIVAAALAFFFIFACTAHVGKNKNYCLLAFFQYTFLSKVRRLKAIVKDSIRPKVLSKCVEVEYFIILPAGPGWSSLLPT